MRRAPAHLVLALLLAGTLYVAFPATVYRGDAMAYADALRHSRPALANPNHLLYGVAGSLSQRLAGLLAAEPDPIRTLQRLGLATALACLILFHAFLRSQGIAPAHGTGFMLCLAFTSGFWLQAISPETFLLSMMLEALVLLRAARYLEEPSTGLAIALGAACGLAILGTQVDLLLSVCMAWVVARAGSDRRLRHAFAAVVAMLLVAGAGFASARAWAGIAPDQIAAWMLGRARTASYLRFSPGNFARDLEHLAANLYPGLSILPGIAAGTLTWRAAGYVCLLAPSAAAFGWLLARSARGLSHVTGARRILAQAIAGYLAGLTLFFTFWANHLSEFWANHWLAIWCLVAMGAHRVPGERLRRVLPAVAASLGLISFLHLALPLNDSDEGRVTAELKRIVSRDDLLIVAWDEDLESAASARRSTFAVNAGTYMNRPVSWIGCWRRPAGDHCEQSAGEEELLGAILRARREARRGWLLDVRSTSGPALAARLPALERVREEFDVDPVYQVGEGNALSGASLRPLGRPMAGPR